MQLNPANRPPARRGHSIAYDSSPAVQAFVVLGGTDASGQPLNDSWKFRASNWTEHFPPPPGRHYPTLFADPISRRLVLFGGAVTTAASTVLGDTWEFDQDRWRQVSVTGPAGRYASASCWMSSSISALLFGGILGDRSINGETWSWNGAGWVQRFPAQSPPPLWGHGMAYDAARDRVVLFGGVPGSAVQNQTWEWDGTNWQQRLPQTVPPGRQSFGMAYDVARARVVIWGGSTLPGPTINDTWEWDGTDWTLRTTAPSATPAPGSGQMVYDASRRRCVLHNVGDQLAWEWDGQSWIRRTPTVSLPPRDGFAMAYDNANARVALVGGYFGSQHPALGINETWFYHPVRPATATERGAACPGSGGMPRLAPLGSARPWLDDSFPVQLTGVPTGSISILFIGASNSLWFNVPLPLPLQGFPGCSLHVSLDLGPLAFVSSQGISLPIPNSPALAGSHLYLQAFTIDTGVQGSITTSNALDLRLAGK